MALQLKVSVNPLDLNVADVQGEVTLAEATCETPKAAGGTGGGDNGGNDNGGNGNGGNDNGGSSDGGSTDGGSDNGGSDNGGSDNGGSSDGGSGNGGSDNGGSGSGGSGGGDVKPQTGTGHAPQSAVDADLAETGSSSTTPYVAGGAAFLLALGAGAMVVARRRAQD